jgi:thioredoxin 1
MRRTISVGVLCLTLGILSVASAAETVQKAYPGLATGVLTHAQLAELPADVLIQCGDMIITRKHVDEAIQKAPEYVQPQLQKNAFFVLENEAAQRLVTAAAKKHDEKTEKRSAPLSDQALIRSFIEALVKDVTVSDKEINEFFEANAHRLGGAKLEQLKDSIRQHLLSEKQQAHIEQYVLALGKNMSVTVNAAWAKEQAAQALDNPVDKARSGDKPALVAFSGAGCCGPDETLPMLKAMNEKWAKSLSVVHVDADREPVLAARFKVQTTPTVIVYAKGGEESARWSGGAPQGEIEAALKKVGVK